MATKKNRPDEDPQQEEMAVVIFRLKGGSHTLQKGFDTISQALSAFAPQPIVRSITTRTPYEIPASANGGTVHTEIEDAIDHEEQQDVESTPAPMPAKGSRGPRKYKFLPDMDLSGGGVSFKEFASKRKPE